MTDDGWHLALTDPAPVGVPVLCIGANGGLFVGERSSDSPARFTYPTTGAQGRRAVMWHPITEPPEWMKGEAREYR